MKKTAICLLISLGIASVLLLLESKPFYQILDLKLFDLQMNLRKAPSVDQRILFVEMDDATIDQLGRWPWPRNVFANITNTLTSLGARQVVFDVTFSQPNQVFIDKEAVGHIFQGKDEINNYIVDETGILKGMQTVSSQDAIFTLEQIRNGLLQYTDTAENKLKDALIDNDEILSAAFKNSNSFIGYSFEIITEQRDIDKDRLYPQVQEQITSWVGSHPEKDFNGLPSSLKENPHFDTPEMAKLFLRSKLQLLIQDNIEISHQTAAQQLKMDPGAIKPEFNFVKNRIFEEKIEFALNNDPQTQMIDLIYQLEIFDADTQQAFGEAWSKIKKEFEVKIKLGKPLPTGQEFLKARNMEPPIELFTNAVTGGGFLNGIPDQDGILRVVPLFIQYKGAIFPHIAIASVLNLFKPQKISFQPGQFITLHNANVDGNLKDIQIPINEKGLTLVNWAGRWKDTYRHTSGADIYRLYYLQDSLVSAQVNSQEAADLKTEVLENEKILKEKVEGSICIIGLTAAGTHDFNPIPYESAYPMVGTHGNVLNSILTEQFITKVPRATDVFILLILAIVVGLSLPFLSSLHGLLFTAIILTSTFLISLYWFNQGFWLNCASPSLLSLFSYLGITSYKFSTEEKAKREIKNAFSKYVSPDVIEEIMKDPSKLQLGGDKRILAVQFSDIRSFTTYCEKRTPEEIVAILNEYLDAMTKVIVEHKGTLDKYVGDEIMAIFGAPNHESPEINSQRAVICGMKMLERLRELHDEWKERGLEPLDIGIGVNTGEMIAGNMGSELRMDYTVIGDAVNLAARTEALTRQFKCHFMITEDTYQLTKDVIEVKQLEAIKVKGKDIPVMMYEVLSLKSDPSTLQNLGLGASPGQK